MTKHQLTPTQRANMLRWILTLEGGGERQYEQARHALRPSDGGFCCLGVACDLHDPKGWDEGEVEGVAGYMYGQEVSVPPEPVVQWLGLDSADPAVTGTIKKARMLPGSSELARVGDTVRQNVSWWNDVQRCTFAEIAKMLRDEYDIHDEEEIK